MNRRAWVCATLIMSGVIAIAVLRTPKPTVARTPPVATRAGSAPASFVSRRHVEDTELPAELRTEPPEVTLDALPATRIAGHVFADHYASELCACVDQGCADDVRERYNRNLGAAQPEEDGRKLHDSFARAADCQRALAARPAPRVHAP